MVQLFSVANALREYWMWLFRSHTKEDYAIICSSDKYLFLIKPLCSKRRYERLHSNRDYTLSFWLQ